MTAMTTTTSAALVLSLLVATACALSATPPPEVFPASVKQALLTKASYPRGSYSTVGWSNRVGTVLTPVSIPGVYTADRPFYWNGIDVGCRMTLIEMGTGAKDGEKNAKRDVFVHSPVALDGPLRSAVEERGYNAVSYTHLTLPTILLV